MGWRGGGWVAVMGFLPVVPDESYAEYKELLDGLVREYQARVEEGLRGACIGTWWRLLPGLSFGIWDSWGARGVDMFLKLTKGHGRPGCETMNRLVMHALDVTVRVMVRSHLRLGCRIGATREDQAFVLDAMLSELRRAIWAEEMSSNNLAPFVDANFRIMVPPDFDWDNACVDEWRVPVGKVWDMKLAFLLGGGEATGLGEDVVRLVLSDTCF